MIHVRIQKDFYKVCPEPQTRVKRILESSLTGVMPVSNSVLFSLLGLVDLFSVVLRSSIQIINLAGDTMITGDNYILEYFPLNYA